MSDEKKVMDQAEDPELNELLDSALKDLDKPIIPATAEKESTSTVNNKGSENEAKEEITVEEVWTEDFIKQAADQFQRNFEELIQNGSGSDTAESFKKKVQLLEGISDSSDGEGASPNFQTAISQALKDLSATTENLQNVPNISETEMAALFGQTASEDGGDIFPFMQGMIQSLLSKEVLYAPLKDLVDRYPIWLNEKRATLPSADLAKYEKQLGLMQKVCLELETEKPDDTEEIKKKRFEKTLALMQEMQSCGQPPEDLIKEEASLFQLDSEANPVVPPVLPGMEDSQNCSVM